MAIVVIYIVLGVLYELHASVVILSGLPSAGLGALLTLMLFKTELNLYAFVGVIMLVGLVKKNGIMMVDFAVEAQRQEVAGRGDPRGLSGPLPADHDDDDGRAGRDAADRAGAGRGAESRRPLGLAVAGGLVVSQLLTLYITPVYACTSKACVCGWQRRRRTTGHHSQGVEATLSSVRLQPD